MKNVAATAVAASLALGAAFAPAARAQSREEEIEKKIERVMTVYRGGSFLGVGVAEITAERARVLNLKEERGVEVTKVEKDSPAEKAGIKEQDVVLEYQGQRVEGTEQFVRLVRETPAGRTVKLLVSRGGQPVTVSAVVAARKSRGPEGFSMRIEPGEFPQIRIPDVPNVHMSWRSPMLGVEAESLTPQLAEFFGAKEGVLVRSVSKDSAAEKAGIKAGDVIVKVDGKDVKSPQEITRTLRSLDSKGAVPVTLVREKRETTVSVAFEERRERERTPRSRSVQYQFEL